MWRRARALYVHSLTDGELITQSSQPLVKARHLGHDRDPEANLDAVLGSERNPLPRVMPNGQGYSGATSQSIQDGTSPNRRRKAITDRDPQRLKSLTHAHSLRSLAAQPLRAIAQRASAEIEHHASMTRWAPGTPLDPSGATERHASDLGIARRAWIPR